MRPRRAEVAESIDGEPLASGALCARESDAERDTRSEGPPARAGRASQDRRPAQRPGERGLPARRPRERDALRVRSPDALPERARLPRRLRRGRALGSRSPLALAGRAERAPRRHRGRARPRADDAAPPSGGARAAERGGARRARAPLPPLGRALAAAGDRSFGLLGSAL